MTHPTETPPPSRDEMAAANVAAFTAFLAGASLFIALACLFGAAVADSFPALCAGLGFAFLAFYLKPNAA